MGHRLLSTLLAFIILRNTLAFIPISKTIEIGSGIIKSGIDKGVSITKKIPTPMEIFRMEIETIVGLPLTVLSDAINKVCSLALSGNLIQPMYTPDINKLSMRLVTETENISIPLNQIPNRLWDNPLFDKTLNTVVLITGWTTDLNDGFDFVHVDAMYRAYKARGNYNFLVVDPAQFINTLYSWSAFNTEEIGKYVGIWLAKLTDQYPREKIHLVGHSMGAQISGAAGRYYYSKKNELLPRITGLDPANICFNRGQKLSGLHRGDAEFIDVIHSNNGVIGKKDPIGDVDFYPNGETVHQPGCLTVFCAHTRAWFFFAESVYPGNENNFMAIECDSLASLSTNLCLGPAIPMGYNVPRNARGKYFLETQAFSPYGMHT